LACSLDAFSDWEDITHPATDNAAPVAVPVIAHWGDLLIAIGENIDSPHPAIVNPNAHAER
jgi:hypothetical protein